MAKAVVLRGGGGLEGAGDHGFDHHVAGGQRLGLFAVLVHHAREQRLIERAPVDADADGLVILDCALDHGAEVVVVFAADGRIAGVDAVLGKSAGRGGIFLEQDVAVVVEVADDGHAEAALLETVHDVRHGGGGVLVVDGDAHNLRAGKGEGCNLFNGGLHVGRVGVGHRLDENRDLPANAHMANFYGGGFSAMNLRHGSSVPGSEASGSLWVPTLGAKGRAKDGARASLCGFQPRKILKTQSVGRAPCQASGR